MEKISRVFQFECQREKTQWLIGERGDRLLTIAYKLNIHHCYTTIIPTAAQAHSHFIVKSSERGCFVKLLLAAKHF